jgi:hypothetical protein
MMTVQACAHGRGAILVALLLVRPATAFAQQSIACDVTARLTSAVTATALQVEVDYAASGGDFVGAGEQVACTPLAPNAIVDFSDGDQARVLNLIVLSVAGVAGPANLARCAFTTEASRPRPSDFSVQVTEAEGPGGQPIAAAVALSEIQCTCRTNADCNDADGCTIDTCTDGECAAAALERCRTMDAVAPSDAGPGWSFGSGVSLFEDWLAVGASALQRAESGAAYLFLRTTGEFLEARKVFDADVPTGSSEFGAAVANDDRSLAVGAPKEPLSGDPPAGAAGTISIFRRETFAWNFETKLASPTPAQGEVFGVAVDLEGDTLVVGAPADAAGAAYVFVRSAGTWSFGEELAASDGTAGDRFGAAVAMDGSRIVVGAPGVNAAYVFERSGDTWSEADKLETTLIEVDASLGASVAVDGETILLGAPGADAGTGAAYVSTFAGNQWSALERIDVPDPALAGYNFGASVAVSASFLGVGAPDAGVFVYRTIDGSPSSYTARQTLDEPGGAGDFGSRLAMGACELVVGAPTKDTNAGAKSGAAYVAALPPNCGVCGVGNGDACDDGDACTAGDVCDASDACVGAPACDETCTICDAGACISICGAPHSRAPEPLAVDALAILRGAVGGPACPPCLCDTTGGGGVTASDALLTLRAAVGLNVVLDCPS